MLAVFLVELRMHPRENGFAVSSVRYPTLAFNWKASTGRWRFGIDREGGDRFYRAG